MPLRLLGQDLPGLSGGAWARGVDEVQPAAGRQMLQLHAPGGAAEEAKAGDARNQAVGGLPQQHPGRDAAGGVRVDLQQSGSRGNPVQVEGDARKRRPGRVVQKLLWPWATRRAGDRLSDLQDRVKSNSVASLCRDEVTWKVMQREDVLYQASGRAFTVKATVQLCAPSR
jgi:hypothetical protein